jgi:hypothetical protein
MVAELGGSVAMLRRLQSRRGVFVAYTPDLGSVAVGVLSGRSRRLVYHRVPTRREVRVGRVLIVMRASAVAIARRLVRV